MRWIVNPYVRWFNRTRRRDGPLFRGRFGGRRIDDSTYWGMVLRYIDLNAPRAGICELPSDHAHGSARAYRWGDGPPWLQRGVVEDAVADFAGVAFFRPEDYDEYAASGDPGTNAHLVERLMSHPSMSAPRFDDLVRAASSRSLRWMQWKTALADGTAPGAAFISPDHALRAAAAAARIVERRPHSPARADALRDLRVALLHESAGLTGAEVARRENVARSTVHAAVRRHVLRRSENPCYDELVARVIRNAVRRSVPMPSRETTVAAEPLIVRSV